MKSNLLVLGVVIMVSCMTSAASAQTEPVMSAGENIQAESKVPTETQAEAAAAPTNAEPAVSLSNETVPSPKVAEPTPTPATKIAEPETTNEQKEKQLAEDLKEFEEFKRWKEMQRKEKSPQAPLAEPSKAEAVTPSPIPTVAPIEKPEELKSEDPVVLTAPDRAWKFVIGYGLMVASDKLNFDSSRVSVGGDSAQVSSSFELKKENSVLFEAQYLRANSWGFIGGVKLEEGRQIESLKLSQGDYSLTASFNQNAPKFHFTTFHLNAVYMWDQLYIPFGLNYSLVTLDDNNISGNYRSETMGLYGSQVGVGFLVNPHFAVELTSWTLAVDQYLRVKDVVLDFNEGTINSTLLSFKFRF